MRNFMLSMLATTALIGAAHADTITWTNNPICQDGCSYFAYSAGNSGTFFVNGDRWQGDGVVYGAGESISGVALDPGNNEPYLAVTGDERFTSKTNFDRVSFTLGSVDAWNSIVINGQTITGAEILASAPWITAGNSSDWLTISGFGVAKSIEFLSSQPAAEIQFGSVSAPETSTWIMMALGFAGLAGVGARRRILTQAIG